MTKEMIQDMSKDNMIKGLYDLSANIIEKDKEIERLNNIIDKAIRELKSSQEGLEEWHFDGYDPDLPIIINILEGSDRDEK